VIRNSKYRHIFATPFQLRDCYGDIRLGNVSQETNPITANANYFAIPWKVPGSICVVPIERKGTVDEETPLIINQQEDGDPSLNDIRFCPHDETLIAGATQSGAACLWRFPEGGVSNTITEPLGVYKGHTKRLLLVDFHPLAGTVLVTTGADNDVKLFDINRTDGSVLTLPSVHKGLVTSLSWNIDGSLLSTFSKDKNLRVFDPRASAVAMETASHQGAKSGKALYLGSKGLLATVGFTKQSEREIHLHDPRNLSNKLSVLKLDNSSSGPLPFWDDDIGVLYLSGKGDGNIRAFEMLEGDTLLQVNEYKSKDPATGMARLPKTVCNVMKCEVSRFLKLTPTGQIIPIRFEVPRQGGENFFQEDLYPDTWDLKPSLSGEEWFSGLNKRANLISLKP